MGTGVGVGAAVGAAVGVGTAVGIAVGTGVGVGVGAAVGVAVGVGAPVGTGVTVGVGLGVVAGHAAHTSILDQTLALVGRWYKQCVAVFGDGAPGNLYALLLQYQSDFVVAQRPLWVLRCDQFFD